MLMLDSIPFYTAFPFPPGPPLAELQNPTHPSIFGYVDYCVSDVPEVVVTTTQTADNLCNGDCDAAEQLTILGGTPPYSITINGLTNTLGLFSTDTTYLNLCAGITDAIIVNRTAKKRDIIIENVIEISLIPSIEYLSPLIIQ